MKRKFVRDLTSSPDAAKVDIPDYEFLDSFDYKMVSTGSCFAASISNNLRPLGFSVFYSEESCYFYTAAAF